ncbi:hypothetical protein [Marinimicrobium sp. ABcell2]|uniref:hypothetical protein n=1 Tax=Marinimicrobium sp. ABcell2 TaxID=3069751 RepID=UPI0027B26D7D|nr:hypothetical protein [Marinimicrobium sp. ABcell2]MDQ2077818.1 hypothetical protein [Marinimicrobium sp. ABcell2]
MLKTTGFIIHYEDNVAEAKLNDSGPASREVMENWCVRMTRLQGLRDEFPEV